MNPLTHHEILELVGPFHRLGRQVDLAASDRANRRLAFKPREAAPLPALGATVKESLVLEHPERGRYRLIRTLTHESGLAASVQMDWRDPAVPAERIDAFPAERLLQIQDGVLVARNYRIEAEPSNKPGAPPAYRAVLRGGEARLPGLALVFDAQTGFSVPAELRLIPQPGYRFAPPDDLLAVLGRAWRPLRTIKQGFKCSLSLVRREPRHTRDGEAMLARTVSHLARTLSEPPARFNARFYRARWQVVARKATGAFLVVAALVSGPLILMIDLPDRSIWRFLAWNMPTFLLIGIFVFPDLPRLRIPQRPRPLPDDAWLGGLAPAEGVNSELLAEDLAQGGGEEEAERPAETRRGWLGWLVGRSRTQAPQEGGKRRGLLGTVWSLARRRA